MQQRLFALLVVVFTLTLSACATRTSMAFKEDTDRITEKSKPIFLMTATITNAYHTSYQPALLVVNVENSEAKETSDRLNFTTDAKTGYVARGGDAGNSYLLRLELDPGTYVLRGMTSRTFRFPINALFFVPLHMSLVSKEPGVYYLGHIHATVRERTGNEFKAGPVIPLIDQAVAGAAGGTFDVVVSDQQAVDEAIFRARFPALQGVTIQKAILPAFDRVKAQEWWAAH